MDFESAVKSCHLRSAIFRTGNESKIFTTDDLQQIHPELRHLHVATVGTEVPNLYWRNHEVSLYDRVPKEEQIFSDWEEYDPREDDWGSLSSFND